MVWTEIKSAVASPRKGVPLTSWGNRLYSYGGWCMGPNMSAIYSNELLTLNLDMPHPNNNLLNSNLSNLSPMNSNRFDAVPQWFTTRTTGTPPSARWGHTLTAVGNQLYLFGGCVDKGPTNEFYAYDISKWSRLLLLFKSNRSISFKYVEYSSRARTESQPSLQSFSHCLWPLSRYIRRCSYFRR